MSNGSSANPTAPRVSSRVAEYFDQEIRAAVDDGGRLVEAGCDIDHAKDLDNAFYSIEVTYFGLQRGQDRQRGDSCGILRLFQRQVGTDLSANDVRVRDRPVTAYVDHVVNGDAGEVIASWREDGRKVNSKLEKSFADHRESVQGTLLAGTRFNFWQSRWRHRVPGSQDSDVVVVEVDVDVVVVAGTVLVVVGADCCGVGRVAMSAPFPVESSVSDPVLAPGVLELAPDRLATQRRPPRSAKADSRLK
jgi:hypothetical protein